MTKWIERLRDLGDAKYPEQIAFLREHHGFSHTHANALVMYVRGSTTSKRYADPEAYFSSIDPASAETVRAILTAITEAFPHLSTVIAWNQPVLKAQSGYVLGLSVSKNHITLNPFSKQVLDAVVAGKQDVGLNKHTFTVPIGWKVSAPFLKKLVRARLTELHE